MHKLLLGSIELMLFCFFSSLVLGAFNKRDAAIIMGFVMYLFMALALSIYFFIAIIPYIGAMK